MRGKRKRGKGQKTEDDGRGSRSSGLFVPGQAAWERVARSGGVEPGGAAHRQRYYSSTYRVLLKTHLWARINAIVFSNLVLSFAKLYTYPQTF